MSGGQKVRLVLLLGLPAMMGQLSTIAMQYIDAMMVGQLGAAATASIGLVSSTTWLCSDVCYALGQGFAVLVAHYVGAGNNMRAREVMKQGMLVCFSIALCVSVVCIGIHGRLPVWLGGSEEVVELSSTYFLVWGVTLPVMQLMFMSNSMLRCSGNMGVPFVIGVLMCALDALFNFLLIPVWGVAGAAVATLVACVVVTAVSLFFLLVRSKELALVGRCGRLRFERGIMRRGFGIALPMAVEHGMFCCAQIAGTLIVASLGTVAIAANAFGIVVESLCYMPGFGIGDAATTLIGQSYGARRGDLIRSFSVMTVAMGMTVMGVMGMVIYIFAPELMGMMTPDLLVRAEGTMALRIEAYAEPMYGASIIVYYIFMGLGDTLVPCMMNLSSIWLIRIPLAAVLASTMGLQGVWLAMCIELNIRGMMFLLRLKMKNIVLYDRDKG